MSFYTKIVWLLTLDSIVARTGILREHIDYYSNSWAIKILGDNETIYEIVKGEGFDVVGEFTLSSGLYRITHPRHPQKSKYENRRQTETLAAHSKVVWVEQLAMARLPPRSAACLPMAFGDNNKSAYTNLIRDRLFNDQWYLHDCRPNNNIAPYDVNVIRVWHELKVFGLNVKVQVIDGGVNTSHPDLKDIIDKNYCWDFIDNDQTPDPPNIFPFVPLGHHGSFVAGVIGMRPGNDVCGAGIAPMVRLGAIRKRMNLPANDHENHNSLLHKVSEIDIKQCSWGPPDNGRTMPGLPKLIQQALYTGITQGRGKKGVIFVFATGNGKKAGDNCNCDYLITSMYTISVSGITRDGKASGISEKCAAIIVSAYGEKMISTSFKNHCAHSFTGTSAAAPVVSAVIALALEVKPTASWRDVQHMLVWTSTKAHLDQNEGWTENAAGLFHSNAFGFGRIDAYKMVKFAMTMKSVPPMNSCVLPIELRNAIEFDGRLALNVTIRTNGCKGLHSEVNYIEHVQLVVTISIWKRGALRIDLISPAGTRTQLLEPRKKDYSRSGLRNWSLDSVRTWGESPVGYWTILISNETPRRDKKGKLHSLTVMIHGTKDMPDHYKQPKAYYSFS